MTREEIKNIVCHVFHFYEVNAENCNWADMHEACGEILKALEQQPCEDCISREAVLEQINCWIGSGEYKYTNATCYLTRRMQDISSVTPQPERKSGKWIPVSERLPEKHGDYLVTIENGDVFNCYFNPDYCYDGYDNGAFTYTQEYFDHETIGSLGSEEFAFDGVVAWMSYEPYKVESEDVE